MAVLPFIKPIPPLPHPSNDDSNISNAYKDKLNFIGAFLDDPTYLGFKVFFDFNGVDYSPLFSGKSSDFLKKMGYENKAQQLDAFKTTLQLISQKSQHYFKSIDGLASLLSFDFVDKKVRGENGEAKITIELYETLKMYVLQAMMQLGTSIWDLKYRRELLPDNLLKFTMHILIQDFRDFHIANRNRLETQKISLNIPRLYFIVKDCVFDLSEIGQMINSVSNIEPTELTGKISIKYYGDVKILSTDAITNALISSEVSDKSTGIQNVETTEKSPTTNNKFQKYMRKGNEFLDNQKKKLSELQSKLGLGQLGFAEKTLPLFDFAQQGILGNLDSLGGKFNSNGIKDVKNLNALKEIGIKGGLALSQNTVLGQQIRSMFLGNVYDDKGIQTNDILNNMPLSAIPPFLKGLL